MNMRIAVLLAAVVSCACVSKMKSSDETVQDVTKAFIAADTSHDLASIDAISDWQECEWVASADFVEPSIEVRVVEVTQSLDTTRVTLQYRLLGSSTGAVFRANVHDTLITIPIIHGGDGRYKIGCGTFHVNHVSAAQFERGWLPVLDSASASRWRGVTAPR